MVVVEAEGETTAPAIPGRILEPGDEPVAFSEPGPDGPTGLGVPVDGVLGAVVRLLPVGGGAGEEEVGVGRRRALLRSRREGEFVEDEVAGGTPATGAVLGQARVGQDLQQDGGDAGEIGVGLDGDGVVDGVHPGAQEGTIGQIGVAGTAGGVGIDQMEGAPGVGLPRHRFLPGGLIGLQRLLGAGQLVAGLLQTPGEVRLAVGQVGLGHLDRRPEAVVAGIGAVVEEGVEAVVLLVGDRIVLVGVTLGAVQGEAQPGGSHGRDPVFHGLGTVFLGITAAFVVDLGVAVEPGGDALGEGRSRQQIARQLVDGELVEGLIAVEGLDHPLAIGPDGPGQIHLIAIRIGIAGQVEPAAGHVFSVVRRGEQPVDQILIGPGRGVGEKCRDLGGLGGQAGEIERDPTDESGPIGLGLLLESFPGQPSHDEPVDGIAHGRRLGQVFRRFRADRRLEGPVFLRVDLGPYGPLADPPGQAGDLGGRQTRALGRHDLIRIGGGRPTEQLAGLGLARHQSGLARFGRLQRRRSRVQTQLRLLLVGTVTFGAAPNQQGLDLGREVGGRQRMGNQQRSRDHGDRRRKQGDLHGLWYRVSL